MTCVYLLWIACGVAIAAAVQSVIIVAFNHQARLTFLFSLVSFAVAGMLFYQGAYYEAHSLTDAVDALHWKFTFGFIAVPLLYFFIACYSGLTRVRSIGHWIGAFYLGLIVLNWSMPYSIRFRELHVSGGHFRGTESPYGLLIFVAFLAQIVWALWRAAVMYRRGDRRSAWLLGLYLSVQFVWTSWTVVAFAGLMSPPPLSGLMFLVLIIVMWVKLGYDIRERNDNIRLFASDWMKTFDTVRTPIVVADRCGHVVRANLAASTLAGHSRIEGVKLSELSGEPWVTATQLVDHVVGEGGGDTESQACDDDGRSWEVTINTFPGDDSRSILAFWDVSNLVELQESLRKREKISAMGTLVAGVAHEVRNPLFGISSMLDAYDDELNAASLRSFSDALRGEVKRLIQLMQDLLNYGKPPALTIERTSLADVIHEAVSSITVRGWKIKVISKICPSVPTLLLDHARMLQVFENLIENAAQHSAPGSTVSVRVKPVEESGRPWVECAVEDQGTGFAQADIERVFDPFYTRREGGTGLGLSIVQRIVEEHGGFVAAANRSEGGASVCVRLPVTTV